MKKGFTYGAAPNLVAESPGMTAPEVAELALHRGLCRSDSADPIRSLATTLAKEVREGRHKEVRAERVGGVLRYYPISGSSPTGPARRSPLMGAYEETVSIRVPRDYVETANLLVEAGQRKTRSEALAWFVREGIHRNQSHIEEVKRAVEQIRAIKDSLAS